MPPRNLYEQMQEATRRVVGLFVGVDTEGPSFRNYCRDVPPLPEGFTIGDAARAYLETRMASLKELS